MKLNPILSKKFLGLEVNDVLGIGCAVFSAELFENYYSFEHRWIRIGLFLLFWGIGLVSYNIVIALIKKYVTKE